jgi:Rap1a immunity proteins
LFDDLICLEPHIKQQTKNKQMPFLLIEVLGRLVSSVGGRVMSASNGELTILTRSPVLGSIAAVVVMIFNCGVAIAGPNQPSADYIMSGCRDAASLIAFSNTGASEEEVARLNFCKGVVVGLSFMGQPYGICVPPGTTSQQAISIVVQYIDGQPARIDEDFGSFAVEALRANWPCSLAESVRDPLAVTLR